MAFLVLTSTTNSISVVFNETPFYDKRDGLVFAKGTWAKSNIGSIELSGSEIVVRERDDFEWRVSHDGSGNTFKIDTVDGVAPSSLDDLYTKLAALIA